MKWNLQPRWSIGRGSDSDDHISAAQQGQTKTVWSQLSGYTDLAEQQSLNEFFRAVPPEDRAKFDELARVLKEQLSDIKVYKIGDEAEKTAYVVGKTKDGKWAGLKTTVVET